jgi:hypothetical protein
MKPGDICLMADLKVGDIFTFPVSPYRWIKIDYGHCIVFDNREVTHQLPGALYEAIYCGVDLLTIIKIKTGEHEARR